MTNAIRKAEHTRRQFLRGVAGAGAAAGLTTAGVGQVTEALAAADVYEVNLLELGIPPQDYRTQWPSGTNVAVKVWDASFRKAHELLAANGGGRLNIPGNDAPYYLRDHQVFDLPSVSVHLLAGSEVMMVGPKNPYLGAPIGFYGGLADGEPRMQRDFAALNGPGKIGYPSAQLEYYERGNGVGISYIKTAVVDSVEVPYAPRFAMSAQYGCNDVTFRNNTVGWTGTPEEITLGGHAVMNVSGGWLDNPRGLRTRVQIHNNTIKRGHRALYIERCGYVQVKENTFGPMGGSGMTLGDCDGAYVFLNAFQQVSRGAWGGSDAMEFADVSSPIWVSYNKVLDRTHRHCVRSWNTSGPITPGRITSRYNTYTKGHGTVFAGSPTWDSQHDTIL